MLSRRSGIVTHSSNVDLLCIPGADATADDAFEQVVPSFARSKYEMPFVIWKRQTQQGTVLTREIAKNVVNF